MMLRCSTESGPASHFHSHNHAHPNIIQMAPFGNDNRGMRKPPSASSRYREPTGAPRSRRCAYLDSPTFQAFADPADPDVLVRVDRSRFQGMVGHLQGRPRDQRVRSITHTHPIICTGEPQTGCRCCRHLRGFDARQRIAPGEPRTDRRRRCCCRRCRVRCCGPTCACHTHGRCCHHHHH